MGSCGFLRSAGLGWPLAERGRRRLSKPPVWPNTACLAAGMVQEVRRSISPRSIDTNPLAMIPWRKCAGSAHRGTAISLWAELTEGDKGS